MAAACRCAGNSRGLRAARWLRRCSDNRPQCTVLRKMGHLYGRSAQTFDVQPCKTGRVWMRGLSGWFGSGSHGLPRPLRARTRQQPGIVCVGSTLSYDWMRYVWELLETDRLSERVEPVKGYEIHIFHQWQIADCRALPMARRRVPGSSANVGCNSAYEDKHAEPSHEL